VFNKLFVNEIRESAADESVSNVEVVDMSMVSSIDMSTARYLTNLITSQRI